MSTRGRLLPRRAWHGRDGAARADGGVPLANGYHHHVGANTWESRGAPAAPAGTARLLEAGIVLDDADGPRRRRAASDGQLVDPSGNPLSPDGPTFRYKQWRLLLAPASKPVEQLSQVIVRFAGDSGDGMQLTGSQFTSETALLGNDISTLPDFPAEIRAPAGSLPGVSGFQLHFADHDILTPGDAPNVLVAMNPAALKTNIKDLPKGGTLIVDADAFKERNLQKAGYAANPLEDGSLDEYQVHAVPLTTLTVGALKDIEGVTPREAERSKNMFALGLMSWLYGRPIEPTIDFLEREVRAKRPEIAEANIKALQAGFAFGETTESFAVTYEIKPAKLKPGTYRNITGNQALSMGSSPRRSCRSCRSSSARTRSRRRRRSSRSSRATSTSACGRSRRRTRSRPWVLRSAPRSAACSASPRRQAPASC